MHKPARFDSERFSTAAARFRAFFDELGEVFLERDDVLIQFQLALLSREHVLMTGPPGTAKSQMAAAVLRRLIDESTGEPSVFARQFTENTVQTDLVGPIDFKTLMESGRTEHFTDEGMLGAVHAFLDEVFDGRDMLLRSTLNLLHERELKQGGVTTVGRIESAFMTSNRYIAEILENARETLLAFLDRVAFVSFIPRGFAKSKNMDLVVRRHGGGFGRHLLSARLSIQDLDVLQDAVDRTFLPEPICDGITRLFRELDAEQAAAMRADREFQPTRYLSTRSAVRAATVLRAASVRAHIVGKKKRPFLVDWDDLGALRYNLVLSGLPQPLVATLLEHETDPRERRQLDIMRTEAEIFERCLAKVPRTRLPDAPPEVDLSNLGQILDRAKRSGNPTELVQAAHAFAHASESGAVGANDAAQLLVETVGALSEHALHAGLTPSVGGDAGALEIARSLSTIADDLENASGATRPLACWLRGRLLEMIDESLRLSSPVTAESIAMLIAKPSRSQLRGQLDKRLTASEALHNLRCNLEAGGSWREDENMAKAGWQMSLSKLEDELVLLWDALFREATHDLLGSARNRRLSQVLADLVPHLAALDKDIARLEALGLESDLRKRVVGPRLHPLIAAAFERMSIDKRKDVVAEVSAVVRELDRAGLGDLIEPERFVAWTAPVLVRMEREAARDEQPVRDFTTYAFEHDREDPMSLVQTLIEIALLVVPRAALEPEHPELATRAVWHVVRDIRPALQKDIGAMDLARISRGITRLHDWWQHLSRDRDTVREVTSEAVTLLEEAVSSGFLRVMRSPAPVRLALEAKNLAEVLPEHAGRANELRKQLRRLDDDSTGLLVELLEGHARRAWDRALADESGGLG